jgi:hypothetical protein
MKKDFILGCIFAPAFLLYCWLCLYFLQANADFLYKLIR